MTTMYPSPVPEPVEGAVSPGVSREIYGMPMFATLAAADLDATVSWYVDGLGFVVLFAAPGQITHLRRWQFQDILVRPASGAVTPGTGVGFSFAAVYDELDAIAEQARAHGGGTVEGPADTPWNTRDLTVVDPDGVRVVLTAGRPPSKRDEAFNQRLKEGRIVASE